MNYETMSITELVEEQERLLREIKENLDYLDKVLPEHEAKLKESK